MSDTFKLKKCNQNSCLLSICHIETKSIPNFLICALQISEQSNDMRTTGECHS